LTISAMNFAIRMVNSKANRTMDDKDLQILQHMQTNARATAEVLASSLDGKPGEPSDLFAVHVVPMLIRFIHPCGSLLSPTVQIRLA